MTHAADEVWGAACALPIPPHLLKVELTDRWVRFYSLPDGKRYPDTADEAQEMRRRADTLLADACGNAFEVMLVTGLRRPAGEEPTRSVAQLQVQPDAEYWREVREADSDDDDNWPYHQRASFEHYSPHRFDQVMNLVSAEQLFHTFFIATARNVIVYFYDGGVDVILPTRGERDQWYKRHQAWASPRSDGL